MAESWVRLWAGMTTDPKWQTIARKSGQPRALVIALFTHLMLEANESEERGRLDALNVEDAASALDCDEEAVEAILDAMQGRVIEDGGLSGWGRRQPAREDSGNEKTGALSSTERSRLHRERKREATQCNARNDDATQCNAPEAESEAETDKSVYPASALPSSTEVAREEAECSRSHPPSPDLVERPTAPGEAGAICRQLRDLGIQGVNPSHAKLLALLQAGMTADEICGVAAEPSARGKGMAWVLATAEGRRRDAANIKPLPRASPNLVDRNRQAADEAKRLIFGGVSHAATGV